MARLEYNRQLSNYFVKLTPSTVKNPHLDAVRLGDLRVAPQDVLDPQQNDLVAKRVAGRQLAQLEVDLESVTVTKIKALH